MDIIDSSDLLILFRLKKSKSDIREKAAMIVIVKSCQNANVRKLLKTLKWTQEAKRLILKTTFIK